MPRKTAMNGLLIGAIGVGAGVICTPAFLAPAPQSHGSDHRIVSTAPQVVGRSAAGKTPSKVKPANGFWRKASPEAESNSLGFFARTAAAAVCAFVASSVNRRKQQQRTSSVAMHWHASACGTPRQKVLRNLDRYGGVPGWSRKPLIKRRLIRPWRKRVTKRKSEWAMGKTEVQRVRFHYNMQAKMMHGIMRKSWRRGAGDPMETFMQSLESRIDNTCWRLGLTPTIPAARQFVGEGHLQYRRDYEATPGGKVSKWRTCSIPSMKLRVGDHIRVKPRKSSEGLVKKTLDEDGPCVKPSHIQWDADKLKGQYLDTCDVDELGMQVDEDMILRHFTGRFGLRKKHLRYHEGSNQLITKAYNGGRPRPTPENKINMKLGKGLHRKGKQSPPSLWGRRGKRPLNNPWENGNKIRV